MNIYIPIEIKVRELEGRLLLGLAAAERGHTVIVGEKKDTIGLATKGLLPPGLVHLKSITPHESMKKMLSKLRKNGHAVTVQDEESGLLDETYDTFAKLRFSEETIAGVDNVFAWGNYDLRSLKQFYESQAHKFVATGSPRVDFWRKDFTEYYSDHTESKDLAGKPYIMVVSNFSGPLNVNRFWNIMARLNEAGYFEREHGREKHEYENAAYQTQLIGEFVFMIRNLKNKFPEYNILIRPHPVESVEGWEKLIGDVPGVYVKRSGTISPWIRHAKLIIHNGCTSAMEASISGQNRIAYRPLPNDIEREIPNKVSLNAYSEDELHHLVDGMLKGQNLHREDEHFAEVQNILSDRFGISDDKLAADKIVDEWEAISSLKETMSEPTKILMKIKEPDSNPKKILKSVYRAVRSGLLRSEKSEDEKLLNTSFKFPSFTDDEFEQILDGLKRTVNRFESVSYQRFGEKSFILTGKK
jgi:surface carbohydrate biosynthesis protein